MMLTGAYFIVEMTPDQWWCLCMSKTAQWHQKSSMWSENGTCKGLVLGWVAEHRLLCTSRMNHKSYTVSQWLIYKC
jgi:hypothetical protein